MFPERKYTILDSNITVDFYDEKEHHTSTLTAKNGRVNDLTNDFEAHGHVVVISDSGSTLKTENLFWTNARKKIHTPDYVDIASPNEKLQGHGFESDQDQRHYIIYRVTGQAKTNE
jgi:LPS export ABC transporter protein LptC